MKARFAKDAAIDLDNIFDYTITTWGKRQADRYVEELEDTCHALAQATNMGRFDTTLGYWRWEHQSHVIFFHRDRTGKVVVARILHEQMSPTLHLSMVKAPRKAR